MIDFKAWAVQFQLMGGFQPSMWPKPKRYYGRIAELNSLKAIWEKRELTQAEENRLFVNNWYKSWYYRREK